MSNAKIVISAADETKGAFASVKQGLGAVQTSAMNVQSALGALAGVAFAASYLQKAKDAINYADGLGKLSQKAGLSTEALSGLVYAGKLADVSQESLAKGIGKLNKEIAAGGETLGMLGISTRDASGALRGAETVFADVADVIASLDDENPQKAALAMKLLGKSGADLIPLMNGGGQAIKEAAEEARRFGLVLDKETTRTAEEFNDNITRLSENMRGGFVQSIQPAVKWLADMSTYFIKVEKDVDGVTAAMILLGKIVSQITGLNPADEAARRASDVALERARVVDKIANLQNTAGGTGPGVANTERALSKLKERLEEIDGRAIKATQNLANVLGADKPNAGGGRGFINPTLVKGPKRELDPSIFKEPKAPTAEKESAYDALNKRIAEQIALMQSQIEKGRELTQVEAFISKLREDAKLSKIPLSKGEQESLDATIASYQKLAIAIDDQNRKNATQKEFLESLSRSREEERASILADEQAMLMRNSAAKRLIEDLQFENSLIGLNNKDRALAIKLREVEALGIRKTSDDYAEFAKQIEEQVNKSESLTKARQQFDDLSDAVTDLFLGKKDSIKAFFESILRESLKLDAIKPMLESIFNIKPTSGLGGLFGGGGGSGGIGGILGGLFKPAGTPFGDVGGAGSAASSVLSSIFGGFFANGGEPPVGKASIVGERGAELFVPKSAGTIIPNNMLGGNTQDINITFINESRQPLDAKARRKNDGSFEVILREVKDAVASDIVNGEGSLFGAMQSRFGLRTAVS